MKKYKLILPLFIFILLFSFLIPNVKDEAEALLPEFSDVATTQFLSLNSGTADDPYIIMSANELAGIAKEVKNNNRFRDKYFVQTQDIDLAGRNWNPIGGGKDVSIPFQGNYNGNNFMISNMQIKSHPDWQYVGLFGYVEYGYIQNITMMNPIIENKSNEVFGNLGCLIGRMDNIDLISDISVFNARIDLLSVSTLGSIIGKSNNVKSFEKMFASGNMSLYGTGTEANYDSYIGGVIGFVGGERVEINEICNETNINFLYKTNSYICGILGINLWGTRDIYISNCINKGNINSVAGIIAGITYRINVSDTYNIGNLSAAIGSIFGIANSEGLVMNSYDKPSKEGLINKFDINIFAQDDKINNGYPFLRWRYHETSI